MTPLRTLSIVAALGVGTLATASTGAAAESPGTPDLRPNVVLVVVDDMGAGDAGSAVLTGGHPHPWHRTPALDRLAREGTVLTQAYAETSCAPSRMALLTGRAPQRDDNRVYGGRRFSGDSARRSTLLRGVRQGDEVGGSALRAATVTVPERLADAGYRTTHVGKFDVTRTVDAITADHGYDVNVGGGPAGGGRSYHASPGPDGPEFDAAVGPGLDAYAEDYTAEYVAQQVAPYSDGVDPAALAALVGTPKHLTDAVGDAALASLDRAAEDPRPFFTSVNHYAVHAPVGPDSARADLRSTWAALLPDRAPAVPAYAAMLQGVDQTVARIVDRLRTTPDPREPDRSLAESTVVLVTSDNGGRAARPPEAWTGSNGPLRGQKFQLWEGGVRVPLVAWSGDAALVAPGASNDSAVQLTDLSATVLALAEVPPDDASPVDGRDLSGLLASGGRRVWPVLHHHPGYFLDGARSQRPASTLRLGRWKVLYDYETTRARLYDLREDPGETRDLSRRHEERTAIMVRSLVSELARLDSDLAVVRAGQGPVTVPTAAGGLTYADGAVLQHDAPGTLLVGEGQEMPLVWSPTPDLTPDPAGQ